MADQSAEGVLSPFLRRRRIAAVRPFLRGQVLDFGCGSGALAADVDKSAYLGIDPDPDSIAAARRAFPSHRFLLLDDFAGGSFDTVAALAVIEHVADPAAFLATLKSSLSPGPQARIVCTTPHPSMDFVHRIGARAGLFSPSASEEHEELLDRRRLSEAAARAGLRETFYRRFLAGANQIVAFARSDP